MAGHSEPPWSRRVRSRGQARVTTYVHAVVCAVRRGGAGSKARGRREATVPNRQRRAAAARVTGGAGGRLTQARATLKAVGNLSLYKLHRSLLYCKIWYVHL